MDERELVPAKDFVQMAEDVFVRELTWKFLNQLLYKYDEVDLDLFLGSWSISDIAVFDNAHVVTVSHNVEVAELARRCGPENE